MNYLASLHSTLTERARPEFIARIIQESGIPWSESEHSMLTRSWGYRPSYWYSSMSDTFERVPGAKAQLETIQNVFGPAIHADPDDPESLLDLVDHLGAPLQWDRNSTWSTGRLTHPERREAGLLTPGRRAYKRRIRTLHHLTEKAHRMQARIRQRELIVIGRSGFAHTIPLERFSDDPDAAMFVAYITARKNLRRQFSLSGKDNPMDKLAAMLFSRLKDDSDWGMVALAWPKPDVLSRLGPQQLASLASRYMIIMRECAVILESKWAELNSSGKLNRKTMIVRRGMDSSTWNETAQAYNTARAGWLACLSVTPQTLALTTNMLPGKVMRLMAADLAYWHVSAGSAVDPNTAVWARLPLPWEVLDGRAYCPANLVRAECDEVKMDPDQTGWTLPLPKGEAAEIKPTPELVHGVTISDPIWAQALRSAGVFAGHGGRGRKPAKDAMLLKYSAASAGVIESDLPLARPDPHQL